MSYDNLSSVSQQLTGEERRIPFIFDDFHFCRSRVIGLDMMENRIFTLCRMINWVVFLRMFWNFISSLPVKRRGSLSFLKIFIVSYLYCWCVQWGGQSVFKYFYILTCDFECFYCFFYAFFIEIKRIINWYSVYSMRFGRGA